jgi:hypothetical protein
MALDHGAHGAIQHQDALADGGVQGGDAGVAVDHGRPGEKTGRARSVANHCPIPGRR